MKGHRPSPALLWSLVVIAVAAGLIARCALNPRVTPTYKGKPIEAWFGQLIDFEPAEAFCEFGADAVPFLRQKLTTHDELRNRLIDLAQRVVPKAFASRLPAKTSAESDRKDAAFALWWLGRDAAPAAPDLVRALSDDSECVRHYAAITLGELGVADDVVLAACRRWLRDPQQRQLAVGVLTVTPAIARRIDSRELLAACHGPQHVSELYACARFFEATGDRRFLERLRRLGAATTDPGEQVYCDLELWWQAGETNSWFCGLAENMEDFLDNPASLRVAELLAEDDVAEHPRSTIASSVDADGKRARLRQLRAFVAGYQTCWIEAPRGDRPTDKDWMGSAEILQHLPSVAAAAVPLLRQGLRGKEFLWRLEVARALGRVGPAAAAAVPDLRRLTHSDFSPDRICAAEALWRIERRQREVLPLLVAAMKSPSSRVRGMAARALLVVENDEPGLLDADLHEAALKAAELPGVPSTLAIAARLEL